jgi:hypothetical protein
MTPALRPPVRLRSYALVFGLIASFLILIHGSLLGLPFYWDEIGQFIPASLDLFHGGFLSGAWIPVSTIPNAHPPGVMAYLAAVWSIFGYSIPATRISMLVVAAFGALFTFLLGIELGRGATGTPAFAALAMLCVSPLFFAQSMLAQLDVPAMCLSILALLLFLQDRFRAAALACVALVLVKETGVAVPALCGCWLLIERWKRPGMREAFWFVLPLPVLLIWLAALHNVTGHWFGNAAFTEYNLWEPLRPSRFIFAVARRLYYLFAGSGHFIGTIALVWAWRRMPLLRERPWRIAAAFVAVNVLVVSALGGAVLERYLLPVLPVIYIAFAISLQALMPQTRLLALAGLLMCLIAANFVNPLYPFPFENNLAFVSFVRLEQTAAAAVELRGGGVVATAFPMANALRNPAFGYVNMPVNVNEIADFTAPEIEKLKLQRPDMVVAFNREWDPLHLLERPAVRSFLESQYGYRPELSADEIARALSMRVARRWTRRGLTMQLLTR